MKIQQAKLSKHGNFTLWLKIPDFYTFWYKLKQEDREFLTSCWNDRWKEKRIDDIKKFMEGTKLSLCNGSISIRLNLKKLPRKRLSWTLLRNNLLGITTELNTPKPPIIKPKGIPPVSRVAHFLTLLQITAKDTYFCWYLKDFITLYILKRDYAKNIKD
jgi:hypothetical protein